MLHGITKCATCVTLNRKTAPFVRLCPVHIRTIRCEPKLGGLRGGSTLIKRPPFPCVPNLPRSRAARGTLSRSEQSNRHMANGKFPPRRIAPAIRPAVRPAARVSVFRRARRACSRAAQFPRHLRHAICSDPWRSEVFDIIRCARVQRTNAGRASRRCAGGLAKL
jgi:hypothetical protein